MYPSLAVYLHLIYLTLDIYAYTRIRTNTLYLSLAVYPHPVYFALDIYLYIYPYPVQFGFLFLKISCVLLVFDFTGDFLPINRQISILIFTFYSIKNHFYIYFKEKAGDTKCFSAAIHWKYPLIPPYTPLFSVKNPLQIALKGNEGRFGNIGGVQLLFRYDIFLSEYREISGDIGSRLEIVLRGKERRFGNIGGKIKKPSYQKGN